MRERRTCRMSFLDGGRRLRFDFFSSVPAADDTVEVDSDGAGVESGRGVLSDREGEEGPGVEDRDLTRDRSIHGFSGGS